MIGVGTRYSDFTTASKTAFQNPDVRFVNLNVTGLDAAKHSGVMLVADAREGLRGARPPNWPATTSPTAYTAELHRAPRARWNTVVDEAYHLDHGPLPAQTEVLGALNESVGPNGTIVQAAGSMPGDLQMLWRAEDPKQYHVEYAFSCMGYEIAGALGIKMAAPEREVYSLVGDGSYLMMAQEIVTAVSENIKLIVVIVQNHGFASIGSLSESLGSQRFGTYYRYRNDGHRPARRRQAADRPRQPTRSPWAPTSSGSTGSPSSARPSTRRGPRPAPPSSTSKPTRSRRCRPPSPGGTCPCPTSPTLDSTQQAYQSTSSTRPPSARTSPRSPKESHSVTAERAHRGRVEAGRRHGARFLGGLVPRGRAPGLLEAVPGRSGHAPATSGPNSARRASCPQDPAQLRDELDVPRPARCAAERFSPGCTRARRRWTRRSPTSAGRRSCCAEVGAKYLVHLPEQYTDMHTGTATQAGGHRPGAVVEPGHRHQRARQDHLRGVRRQAGLPPPRRHPRGHPGPDPAVPGGHRPRSTSTCAWTPVTSPTATATTSRSSSRHPSGSPTCT